MALTDVVAVLRANTSDFTAKIGESQAQMDKLGKSGASNFEKMGKIASTAMLGIAGAAVGVAVASTDLALKYQSTTTSIAANADISVKAAGKITSAFLDTAGKTVFSAQQIGTAYSTVAGQLGATEGHALNAKQAMTVMSAAMDLAEGSGTDLGTATTTLAATMQAYAMKAQDAGLVSDVLFNTSRALGTGINSVGGEFQKLHSTLGIVTPDIGQLGGILIDLTEHGETGRKALSAVNTSMNGLLVPTKAAAQAQQLFGLNFQTSTGQFVGFSGMISELQPKLAGLTQEQQLAVLKSIGLGTANKALLSSILAGPAAFDKATAAAAQQGAAHAAAAKQSQTFAHQLETLKAAAEDEGIKIGQKLIPVLESLMKVVVQVIDWMSKHRAIVEIVAIALGVTLVAGYAAATIAAMTFWTAATGGIILLVAAIGLGVAYIVTHWKQCWTDVKNWFDDALKFLRSGFGTLALLILGPFAPLAMLALHWQAVWSSIRAVTNDVWHALHNDVFAPLVNFFTLTIPHALQVFVSFFTAIPGTLLNVWDDAINGLHAAWSGVANWVHSNVIQPVVNFFTAIPGTIAHVWSDVVNALHTAWSDVSNWVSSNVIQPTVQFFTGLPGKVGSVLVGFFGTAFSSLLNVGGWLEEKVWSPMVSFWSGLPARIGKAVGNLLGDITGSVTGTIGKALSVVGLAVGGIVTSPTLAVIGEGGGPEAVLPLNDPARMAQILAQIPSHMAGGAGAMPSAPAVGASPAAPTVNVYVANAPTPAQIAAEVAWALRTMPGAA
jgi:TP901 family phage tail tape measure protein